MSHSDSQLLTGHQASLQQVQQPNSLWLWGRSLWHSEKVSTFQLLSVCLLLLMICISVADALDQHFVAQIIALFGWLAVFILYMWLLCSQS